MWIKNSARYSSEQFKQDYPNVSMRKNPTASQLAEYGIYEAVEVDQPDYDKDLEDSPVESFVQVTGVWTQTWTIPEKPLAEAKTNMKVKMKKARQLTTESTFTANVGATPYDFHCDQPSRSAIHQTIDNATLAGLLDTDTTNWKLADGSFLAITYADLRSVGLQMAQYIQTQFTKEATKIAAIDAALSIDDLRLISW